MLLVVLETLKTCFIILYGFILDSAGFLLSQKISISKPKESFDEWSPFINLGWCLFVLFFFPRGVLDEILNLIESVSEGFPSYFCNTDYLG